MSDSELERFENTSLQLLRALRAAKDRLRKVKAEQESAETETTDNQRQLEECLSDVRQLKYLENFHAKRTKKKQQVLGSGEGRCHVATTAAIREPEELPEANSPEVAAIRKVRDEAIDAFSNPGTTKTTPSERSALLGKLGALREAWKATLAGKDESSSSPRTAEAGVPESSDVSRPLSAEERHRLKEQKRRMAQQARKRQKKRNAVATTDEDQEVTDEVSELEKGNRTAVDAAKTEQEEERLPLRPPDAEELREVIRNFKERVAQGRTRIGEVSRMQKLLRRRRVLRAELSDLAKILRNGSGGGNASSEQRERYVNLKKHLTAVERILVNRSDKAGREALNERSKERKMKRDEMRKGSPVGEHVVEALETVMGMEHPTALSARRRDSNEVQNPPRSTIEKEKEAEKATINFLFDEAENQRISEKEQKKKDSSLDLTTKAGRAKAIPLSAKVMKRVLQKERSDLYNTTQLREQDAHYHIRQQVTPSRLLMELRHSESDFSKAGDRRSAEKLSDEESFFGTKFSTHDEKHSVVPKQNLEEPLARRHLPGSVVSEASSITASSSTDKSKRSRSPEERAINEQHNFAIVTLSHALRRASVEEGAKASQYMNRMIDGMKAEYQQRLKAGGASDEDDMSRQQLEEEAVPAEVHHCHKSAKEYLSSVCRLPDSLVKSMLHPLVVPSAASPDLSSNGHDPFASALVYVRDVVQRDHVRRGSFRFQRMDAPKARGGGHEHEELMRQEQKEEGTTTHFEEDKYVAQREMQEDPYMVHLSSHDGSGARHAIWCHRGITSKTRNKRDALEKFLIPRKDVRLPPLQAKGRFLKGPQCYYRTALSVWTEREAASSAFWTASADSDPHSCAFLSSTSSATSIMTPLTEEQRRLFTGYNEVVRFDAEGFVLQPSDHVSGVAVPVRSEHLGSKAPVPLFRGGSLAGFLVRKRVYLVTRRTRLR